MTNAHCVDFALTILARREGQNDKYEARILAICHQVDLAIITVREPRGPRHVLSITACVCHSNLN